MNKVSVLVSAMCALWLFSIANQCEAGLVGKISFREEISPRARKDFENSTSENIQTTRKIRDTTGNDENTEIPLEVKSTEVSLADKTTVFPSTREKDNLPPLGIIIESERMCPDGQSYVLGSCRQAE